MEVQTKDKVLNLYEALAGIRKMTEVLQKNRSGFGYKYVDITEILARVTAGLEKYNVSLIPRLRPETGKVEVVHYEKSKALKDGTIREEKITEYLVTMIMDFTWVNNAKPDETITVPWFVVGSQSDPSQAFGSGMTYCTRYFLQSYFQIASPEDDVDAWRSKQAEAKEKEDLEIAKSVLEQVTREIVSTLSRFPENSEAYKQRYAEFSTVIKSVVLVNGKPSAQYQNVKDPAVAAKLLEKIKEFIAADAAKPTKETAKQSAKITTESVKE